MRLAPLFAVVAAALAAASARAEIQVLSAENFESALLRHPVSLVEFTDSACHGCRDLDETVLNSLQGVGVFRLDLAASEANHRVGARYGAVKGAATTRVFRGKAYAGTYQGGRRETDVANFLSAVRERKPIAAPNSLRPLPSRRVSAPARVLYETATAGNRAPVAPPVVTIATAVDAGATTSVAGQQQTSAGDSSSPAPYNYTAEAQALLNADDSAFVPKDPRHLGIYEYAAWHRHQVERVKDPNDSALDVKFIVFQELAKVLGFGNQVEGLLSTLMFAMMTKRVFVIDWGRDHNGVDPLELFQDLPLEADLRVFLPHFATIMDDNHLRTLQRKAFNGRNPNDGCMVPSPDWVCADLDAAYADPVIILKGNIYSGHILSYNSHYQDVYTFLFGERGLGNNPYSSLFQWFLRPLPYILERVAKFKAENFAPVGDPQMRTVGIHMRVRDSFLKEQSVPFFWECAQGNFRLNNTVFYLATDNPVVQHEAQTQLAPGNVTWYKQIGNDKNSLRADAEHRLADLLLLGECDDLVVTCGSSYSRVAFSRADIAPLFVTFQSHRWSLRHAPHQCLRAATAKPCAARYLNQIDKVSRYRFGAFSSSFVLLFQD
eukprot:INCI17521.2.p2 GENE.INCI17521.2~~INCI17521.2.p2  ORF type:complete len:605 (+),score=93.79 INCI17521.2:117-1931(+)